MRHIRHRLDNWPILVTGGHKRSTVNVLDPLHPALFVVWSPANLAHATEGQVEHVLDHERYVIVKVPVGYREDLGVMIDLFLAGV
jgi:hypothetical protein